MCLKSNVRWKRCDHIVQEHLGYRSSDKLEYATSIGWQITVPGTEKIGEDGKPEKGTRSFFMVGVQVLIVCDDKGSETCREQLSKGYVGDSVRLTLMTLKPEYKNKLCTECWAIKKRLWSEDKGKCKVLISGFQQAWKKEYGQTDNKKHVQVPGEEIVVSASGPNNGSPAVKLPNQKARKTREVQPRNSDAADDDCESDYGHRLRRKRVPRGNDQGKREDDQRRYEVRNTDRPQDPGPHPSDYTASSQFAGQYSEYHQPPLQMTYQTYSQMPSSPPASVPGATLDTRQGMFQGQYTYPYPGQVHQSYPQPGYYQLSPPIFPQGSSPPFQPCLPQRRSQAQRSGQPHSTYGSGPAFPEPELRTDSNMRKKERTPIESIVIVDEDGAVLEDSMRAPLTEAGPRKIVKAIMPAPQQQAKEQLRPAKAEKSAPSNTEAQQKKNTPGTKTATGNVPEKDRTEDMRSSTRLRPRNMPVRPPDGRTTSK